MLRLHVCLICHTEGRPKDFEVGIPAMLRIREAVEQASGKPVGLTWALGTFHATAQSPIFDAYRDLFANLHARGDEIGLHPHGVVQDGRWTVDPFVAEDTQRLQDAGFPAPTTFVAGVWAFYPSTLAMLEAEGYAVDASVVAGPTRQRQVDGDGNVLYDYPPSQALADSDPLGVPYRLSRDSVVQRGASTVVEVPVAGHLMDLAPGGGREAAQRLAPRRQRLASMGVDIHEIFWHPWELLEGYDAQTVNLYTQAALQEFLIGAASDPEVCLSTVREATMDWVEHAEDKRSKSGVGAF